MGEERSVEWKGRRDSERWIEQEGKGVLKLCVGDGKALYYSYPPEPPPALPQAGDEGARGRTKRQGPSASTEGPLSLRAEEQGVLQYSPAAWGH